MGSRLGACIILPKFNFIIFFNSKLSISLISTNDLGKFSSIIDDHMLIGPGRATYYIARTWDTPNSSICYPFIYYCCIPFFQVESRFFYNIYPFSINVRSMGIINTFFFGTPIVLRTFLIYFVTFCNDL